MLSNRGKLLWKATLVASFLSPFVFFSSSLKPWTTNNSFYLITQETIYPLEYLWGSTLNLMSNTWNHYFALNHAAQENSLLKSEITRLRTQILDYEEKILEIKRLRELLGFTQNYDEKNLLVAEVISSPKQEPFYSIRIGKGEDDGVNLGMPIVTANGVVGRVIRSASRFSDVQLLVDSNFNIDVLLQRTRIRGVLKGDLGTHCLLKLNRRAEIRIGDTVISSGIVGGFPKGLPIGRVVRISYESDNISQIITVEPWVDYHRVEEVIGLRRTDQEIQKIMETVGKAWFKRSLETVGS